MNARWFTPLLLLCFALFVLGAKAYISRTPRDVIEPPAIAPAQRIYGQIPAAAHRDAALSRVFKPRPRSLDPLPIMAMTRPIPEPIRPGPRGSNTVDKPISEAFKTAVAMANPEPAEPPPPAPAASQAPPVSDTDGQQPSEVADDTATDVASVLADNAGFSDPEMAGAAATSAPAEVVEAAGLETAAAMPPQDGHSETHGLPWREALIAVADQIDSAAVRLRSNYENGPAATLTRAFDALSAGQFDRALRDFDAVLARNANLSQAWSGKGEALVGLNRFDDAADAYARAMGDPSIGTTTRYNYGVVLYRLSRYADAGEQFRAVVTQDPDHAEGHYNLATLAQRDGRLSEALEAWKVFTRLRPTVAGGWFNLGIVYMDYDRPSEAVACFKQVIELDQNDADAHINLAMAYLASDQPAEALTALENAESRLPGDRVVLRYLADVHAQLAETGGPDAAMHLEKAKTCRSRIAAAPSRGQRKAVAGSPTDTQP